MFLILPWRKWAIVMQSYTLMIYKGQMADLKLEEQGEIL